MLDYIILVLLVILTLTILTGRTLKIELKHIHNHIIESQYKDLSPKTSYSPLEEDPELEKLYKEKVDPMETVWKTVHDIMEGDKDGR